MLRSVSVVSRFPPLSGGVPHSAPRQTDAKSVCTTIRSSALADFRRVAASLKLDPLPLMKRAGIDPKSLDDCDRLIPMRAVNELFELAAFRSGVEDFGLRFAQIRGLPDLGPVTLVLREEETFRAALQTLIAFMHLHSDGAYFNLREGGEYPILTIDIILEGPGHRRQIHDGSVASVVNLMRWLLGERWSPASVCFTHSRPIDIGRFDAFFRCPIDFNHEFNGIVLRRQDLEERLPASSPAMRRHLQRYLQTLGATSGQSYVHRVTQVIGLALSRGEGRVDIVARHLGIDPRTLNRRLAKEGVNYSSLLENIRRNIAVQHLRDGDRLLSDIAGLVGFSSLSAFSTWFHQAFDCAPSSWRKRETLARS